MSIWHMNVQKARSPSAAASRRPARADGPKVDLEYCIPTKLLYRIRGAAPAISLGPRPRRPPGGRATRSSVGALGPPGQAEARLPSATSAPEAERQCLSRRLRP